MLNLLVLLACGDSEPAASASPSTPAAPAAAPAAEKAEYKGTFANDPKLTPLQVAMIPKDQLPLVRNEIFARYGREFKTDAIRKHFESQAWYQADPKYSDSVLTANDKHNAALIKSFEAEGTNPWENGEYIGETNLMFVDASTVSIGMGGGMYEHLNQTRHFETRGDYVLTWAGDPEWDPANSGCSEAELWLLDHESATAERVGAVDPGRG